MASLRSVATNEASGTSVTVNVPSGTVDGDVMIAQISWMSNTVKTVTPPGGWTLLETDVNSAFEQRTYVRVASSEPANYAWTFSGTVRVEAGIGSFIGVDNTTPIDVSNGQFNSSSTSVTAPSVTTTVANALLVFCGSGNGQGTYTPPSGMTEQWDDNTTIGTLDVSFEMAIETLGAAGATGTRVATLSGALGNIGQLIALKPAAVAADEIGARYEISTLGVMVFAPGQAQI